MLNALQSGAKEEARREKEARCCVNIVGARRNQGNMLDPRAAERKDMVFDEQMMSNFESLTKRFVKDAART